MSTFLFVLAPKGYQDIEYGEPRRVLEEAGNKVLTVSTQVIAHGSLGGETRVDLLLDQLEGVDYDGVVFVGGPGSHVYFKNPLAQHLAQEAYGLGKITAAICAGPGVLAEAGLLSGKKATSYPSVVELLREKGAIHTAVPVERDGLLITANGPQAARAFGEVLLDAVR